MGYLALIPLDWTSPLRTARRDAVTSPGEGSLRSASGGGAGDSDLTDKDF